MKKHIPYELTDQAAAIDAAVSEGYSIEYGSSTILLLDMDDKLSLVRYRRVLKVLQDRYPGTEEVERWESRSGNTHIKVMLPKYFDEHSRIAIQCALGSDPVCELLRLERSIKGEEDAIILFRPKRYQNSRDPNR